MTKAYMIMAIGPDNVIGKGDKLAWHSKMDFMHFVRKTTGWPCIFGATTFYGLPKYPLKNRLSIVVNIERDKTELFQNENGYWIETNSIDTALDLARNYDKVFVCGGKSIYEYCLKNNLIDTIYLTEIYTDDDSLEDEIASNPNDYVRFPINIKEYVKDWYKTSVTYTGCDVSEKYKCISTKFTKENPDD